MIALSVNSARSCIKEVFRAGALAYLIKNCEFDELTQAVRTVAEGKIYVSPSISHLVVEDMVCAKEKMEPTAFCLLTPREREILQFLAEGKTIKPAALRLHLGRKTIEAHRRDSPRLLPQVERSPRRL